MKNKLLLLSLSALMSVPLFACAAKSESNGWDIKEADYHNIIEYEDNVSQENGKYVFKIEDEFGSFKDELNQDEVILFNLSNLKGNKENKYYSYQDYKNSEVSKDSFTKLENGLGFTIEFDGNPNDKYGIIANKNTNHDNQYVYSAMSKSINERKRIKQADGEWVKDYIESSAEYISPEVPLQIEMYIANIVFGGLTSNPIAVINGIYGLLGTFFNVVKPAEPSIQDVLDKLADMDKKLDQINEEIQKNQKELINEMVYEQAQIDKVLATLYQQDFTAFITDYVDPMDSIERKYSQYIENCYKVMVKAEPQTIELHYKRNDKNQMVLISQSEVDYNSGSTIVYQIKVDDYANALQYLKDHNDIVSDGFTEALNKDINKTISNHRGKDLSTEINEKQYLQDINSAITDEFEKNRHSGEYGSEAYNDAANMLDKAILLLKRISGTGTGESIFSSIINRVGYIYNFASETKEKVDLIIANIKLQMERFVAMTSTACRYAKINTSEMAKEYVKAIETIQAYHKANIETKDNFCYITGKEVDSAFMWSKYDAKFKNLGEEPSFMKEFLTKKIDGINRYQGTLDLTPINIAKTPLITGIQQSKILTRYHMLLSSGLTDETDYMNYLVKNKGIEDRAYQIQQIMIKDNWLTDDTSRILTDYEGVKDLVKEDNIKLTCTQRGNDEGGNYFKVGSTYSYKGSRDAKYWSGEKAIGRFIDCHTGAERASHLISAWARYSEMHSYWMDNEHWAFSSNPGGSYFYIMYNHVAD